MPTEIITPEIEERLSYALDAELKGPDVGPGYAAAPRDYFGAALGLGKKLYTVIADNDALIQKLLPPDVGDALDKTEKAVVATAAAVAAIVRVVRPV